MNLSINHLLDLKNKNVELREISTADQIKISKILTFSDSVKYKYKSLFKNLTNYITTTDYLSYIDLIAIFLKLRIISYDSNIKLKVSIGEDREASFDLNIFETYSNLIKKIDSISHQLYTDSNIVVTCDVPSAVYIADIIDLMLTDYTVDQLVPFCIKDIYFKDIGIKYNLSELTAAERERICGNLPLSIYNRVLEYVVMYAKHFSTIFIYKSYTGSDVFLNVLSKSFIEYIEFLFAIDLSQIHEQVYILCNVGNVDFTSAMGMSELERNLYISLIKKQQEASNNKTNTSSTESVDILSSNIQDQDELLMNQLFS